MSVFNRKFSIGDIRDGMLGNKTTKSRGSLRVVNKNKKTSLSEISEDLSFDIKSSPDRREIETKLLKKKDTLDFKELSTFDTVTKMSSNTRKLKRVKFSEPFITEVVKIESYKKYYLQPESSKKKQVESCRCLIF
jgi:hypothetical protein